MKRLILILIGSIVTMSTFAQVNGTLAYQGYLTDGEGEPVNDGEMHSFVFKFYNAASTEVLSRTISSEVDKGLFSVIIGGGTGDNAALPTDIWDVDYTIGISVDGGAELTPRIPLTTVPYSFQAETANSANSVAGTNITGTVSGSQIGTGISGANISDGTLPTAKISGTIAVANGGTNATTEAAARTNLGVAIGSDVQAYDADLDDLADGSLTGSKVGAGISGANISDGTIPTAKISGTIAITDGGTNATTEADARTNLGLVIGSDVQAYDADLAALAGGSVDGSFVGSGIDGANITNGTVTTAKIDGTIAVANGGTGASTAGGARSNLNLVVGTNIQAYDASLQSISALSPGADGMLYTTGTDTYALTTLTSTGRDILDDNSTAAVLTTIGAQPLDADLTDLAVDGSLPGSKVDPDFGAQNITTTGNIYMNGLHVGAGTDPGSDNLDVDGFTQLGTSSISVSVGTVSHPAIKYLLIEGTTASTQGGVATVTVTGLTDANIISIDVLVEYDAEDYIGPHFTGLTGYEFSYRYQGGILIIRNITANSVNITSDPFKATIIYTD